LVFPVSYIIYEGLDYLFSRYILKRNTEDECFINFPGGITAAAVFICINIAENFPEAFLLSFGFTSGILVVFLTIREIRRRAILEAVPRFMQGNPLILVSMGLLSLIFSMVSLLVLRMISIG
jgi:Na+-transporting NADH:ubiquinone oxidoreductase subunit NqrE